MSRCVLSLLQVVVCDPDIESDETGTSTDRVCVDSCRMRDSSRCPCRRLHVFIAFNHYKHRRAGG